MDYNPLETIIMNYNHIIPTIVEWWPGFYNHHPLLNNKWFLVTGCCITKVWKRLLSRQAYTNPVVIPLRLGKTPVFIYIYVYNIIITIIIIVIIIFIITTIIIIIMFYIIYMEWGYIYIWPM